jgi:hypothetical protein
VADGLLAVAEALDRHGHERVEVDLEVVAGEHGGGGERLERALDDAEVAVPREVHAGVDQRRHLCRRQSAPRRAAASSASWRRSTPASRPFMSLARAASSAASISGTR